MQMGQPAGQSLDSFFAFHSPRVVFAARQFMLNHGVANYQAYVGWNREEATFQRAAIEQQRMARLPIAGNEWVHDSDVRADEFVFGTAAEFGEFETVHWQSRVFYQGKAGDNLYGCG